MRASDPRPAAAYHQPSLGPRCGTSADRCGRSAHGRANHSLVLLESRPPARDDREDRASRSSAVIFCCAHPPRLARLARGIRARLKFGIRRALFLLRRCSFTMDKARLLYRCAPARLPLRSAPAKVGFSHRASSCARGGFDFIFGRLGGRLHPAQMELVGVWAVGAAGGGCGGAVGGHRQPIPRRAREICVQNRPRRRAASPRGASVCLSCVV